MLIWQLLDFTIFDEAQMDDHKKIIQEEDKTMQK
jgi:hypothetical protein